MRFVLQGELYRGLEHLVPTARKRHSHPYSNLPDHCFWHQAVAAVPPAQFDPIVNPKFQMAPQDRIATAGSCFAQHIARTLIQAEFNYFVAEQAPPGMSAEVAGEHGYGLFSARFGNVYSVRQLLQLFQRAYGEFAPRDTAWPRAGRFVDPFRPQIEPDGFASPADIIRAQSEHLTAVRNMFEQTQLFVFTVGLTETWMARSDGAVFPVAPAVVSDTVNSADYRFVNFTVSEIVADLNCFIAKLHRVNPHVRLLLTVSPVPLVATYENRHVMVSTTYSKSAIRAAVDEVARANDRVDYFPSYEIITGWYNKGSYFEPDLRSVTQQGIDHVMRVFSAHYLRPAANERQLDHRRAEAIHAEIANVAQIMCDEELLRK